MKTIKRLYCIGCSDFTLHKYEQNNICLVCGCNHVPMIIADIDPQKVSKQILRYKRLKHNKDYRFTQIDGETCEIIETDCGYSDKRDDFSTHNNKQHKQTTKIPRNALCPCGSNKKYKHCCMG